MLLFVKTSLNMRIIHGYIWVKQVQQAMTGLAGVRSELS